MASNTVVEQGHGQRIIEAMATKFSEKFAVSMLKKHRKFCRRGLTHLDATPIVNTYETLYS